MKKTIAFIFLFLIALFACKEDNTEPPSSEPNYLTFDGSIWKNDNSTILSSDDNLIICGNANYDHFWSLIKVTKAGQELWRSDFPSDDIIDNGCAVAEGLNGDIFICGNTHRNMSSSKIDILLYRTNPNGDTIWSKTYGTQKNDYGQCVIATSDGNLLISGHTAGTETLPPVDIYLLKLDYDGDTLWTRLFENPGLQNTYHLLESQGGDYLITGGHRNNDNPHEIYLLKVDPNGTKLWDKYISDSIGVLGYSTIELSNTNLVICGYQQGGSDENSQLLAMKTDNAGNIIWEQEYGEENRSEKGYSIKENLDGSYTITGTSYEKTGWYLEDIILLKINSSGKQIWFNRFGNSETDRGRNLIKDLNDDNLITGDYGWSGPIFLTITDKDGNFK